MKKLFVTVGTTKFPKLVNTITEEKVFGALIELGFDFIQIQTGKDFKEVKLDQTLKNVSIYKENKSTIVTVDSRITIKYDDYFENFEEEITSADLVISHAGAGSCLDILRQNKPLIVVINEELMNNHQTELAEQLQKNEHLYYCTCKTLGQTLKQDFNNLKPYPTPNKYLFSSHLDKYCGFTE